MDLSFPLSPPFPLLETSFPYLFLGEKQKKILNIVIILYLPVIFLPFPPKKSIPYITFLVILSLFHSPSQEKKSLSLLLLSLSFYLSYFRCYSPVIPPQKKKKITFFKPYHYHHYFCYLPPFRYLMPLPISSPPVLSLSLPPPTSLLIRNDSLRTYSL